MDALALIVAAVVTRGGPAPTPPPSGDPVDIVIYSDDHARGVEECRIELASAPVGSTCDIEPAAAASSLSEPGWAWEFAPAWAERSHP